MALVLASAMAPYPVNLTITQPMITLYIMIYRIILRVSDSGGGGLGVSSAACRAVQFFYEYEMVVR